LRQSSATTYLMNSERNDLPVLVLIGPTAIGKTSLSLELARLFNCEIISVDSMQVYKYMDVGTAKITVAERGDIAHHLLDIIEPDDAYDAARFAKDAATAITEIQSNGKIPLLTGGTGLYLKALTTGIFQAPPSNASVRSRLKSRLAAEGAGALHKELLLYDCISAELIHPNNIQRLLRALEIYHTSGKPLSSYLGPGNDNKLPVHYSNMLKIGLRCDRSALYDRINRRTEIIIAEGFEEEVRGLLARGYGADLKSMSSIGYRHMMKYIRGEWSREKMIELLARDTRRYAKRQITWFKKEKELIWIDKGEEDIVKDKISKWLSGS